MLNQVGMTMRLGISSIVFLIIICVSCSTTQQAVTTTHVSPVPVMTFTESVKDLGIMTAGDTKKLIYTFTNTGTAPLIIELATTCKCTDITWPKEPVPPGGSGEIVAVFDSSGFEGVVKKSIDIIANTDPIVVEAKFVAEVVLGEK